MCTSRPFQYERRTLRCHVPVDAKTRHREAHSAPTSVPRMRPGFVVAPIANDVDDDWSAGRPNRHRVRTRRKFASVARVLCDTDGLYISTTAPPDECPVAFTRIQFPAGALDLYVNNPYVPSSSVFSGVVLYPTPLFDTVTCVTPRKFPRRRHERYRAEIDERGRDDVGLRRLRRRVEITNRADNPA